MEDKHIPLITTTLGGSDYELFKGIVNQGIDSHLEAFTESKFYIDPNNDHRFVFDFADSERPILLRRLWELDTEEADSWAADIEVLGNEGFDV